jgi:hypothetical protein
MGAVLDEEEMETEETDGIDGNQESTDFESINPDDLPEELKPIYNNMLADYTRSKQELSSMEGRLTLLEEDSATLEYLLSDSKIRERVASMQDGIEQPVVEQPKIDPATDPAGYLAQVVEQAVDKKVSAQISELRNTLLPLLSDRNQQMAQTEWQGVLTKYPAAQAINVNQVNRILADNPKLSMEQAAILADPSIISRVARLPKGVPPKIEISSRKSGTAKEEVSALNRSQQLRQAFEKQEKGSTMNSIINKVLSRVGGK